MPRPQRIELILLAVVVAVHGFALFAYFVPTVGGGDAHGYQDMARRLAHGEGVMREPAELPAFLGQMWVEDGAGHAMSKYPPFYPALSALTGWVFGASAGLWVSPISAVLAVVGVWLLVRSVLSAWMALLAAVVTATLPTLNSFAVHQVSHALDFALVAWSFALFSVGRTRGVRPCMVAAGVGMGCAIATRYADALLLAPMVLWLLGRAATRRHRWSFGIGLAVPCAMLAVYHGVLYGSPWRTGYALTDEQTGFAWGFFVRNAKLYAEAFVGHGLGPLFVVSCVGLVATWRRDRSWTGLFLVWTLPLAFLYTSYYWAPGNRPVALSRFLLPLTLPGLLLGLGFLGWLVRSRTRPLVARTVVAAVVVGQVAWGVAGSLAQLESRHGAMELELRRVAFVVEHVPEGAAMFADTTLVHSLDYQGRWQLFEEELLQQDRAKVLVDLLSRSSPTFVQPSRLAAREHYLDRDASRFHAETVAMLDELQGRGLYLVACDRVVADFCAAYGGTFRLEPVARLEGGAMAHLLLVPGDSIEAPATRIVRIVRA